MFKTFSRVPHKPSVMQSKNLLLIRHVLIKKLFSHINFGSSFNLDSVHMYVIYDIIN